MKLIKHVNCHTFHYSKTITDMKDEMTTFKTTFLEKNISSQGSTMNVMFSSVSSYVNMTTSGLVFIKQTITTKSESKTSKIFLKICLVIR